MAWQDVNRIERDGNVWILRFNPEYGDFTVGTTAGRIRMSVEDGRITVCINGIGYVDSAECGATRTRFSTRPRRPADFRRSWTGTPTPDD